MEWTERTQEVAIEKEMQTMLSSVVAGELTARIAMTGKAGFFEGASGGINQLADNMMEIVRMVKEASGEVYRASREIASGNSIRNPVVSDSQRSLGPAVIRSNHASQISNTPELNAASISNWRRR